LLEQTFVHIQGIGRKTEHSLWERGIRTWHDFLARKGPVFSPARDSYIRYELEKSIEHRDDVHFFRDRLSSGEMWRLFPAFEDKAVYLDIETSGGYQGMDEITVIGIYDGMTVQSFVNGVNLDEFERAVARFEMVITFNGSSFDLPFIRRWFRDISLPPAHIDLRFLLKRLGYSGGLKNIERELGISREADIEGLNGFDAVILWQRYQWGDQRALDKLIRYNRSDIINLKPLMELGYREMKAHLLPHYGETGTKTP
jgi:uncharacterized protein YprB with RNaseH-like and TPR domain